MSTVPRYLKQLPPPIRMLLRPWLLVALGLHAIVLFLPLLPDAPEPEPELISLTELPPTAVPPPTVSPTPSASLPLKVPPAPVAPPTMPTAVARPQIAPPVSEPVRVPESSPAAVAATPAPVPPSSAQASTPSSPLASPSPVPSVEPSPTVPAYLANFPHAATTQACEQLEQCWRSPDSQWRGLARTLEADLATQGYTLTEMPLDDETGRRVYEVSKMGEVVYYLNVISTLEGTVYRLTEQPLTPEEMDAIAGF